MMSRTSPLSRNLLLVCILAISLSFITACQPRSTQPETTGEGAYIENKGSDTIVNLALAWAERYQEIRSDVRISVTGGGSGTGIASLINGTVDIANASRQIKQEEIDEAMTNGVDPFEIVIARDAIAVIVHPNNPVSQLTLQQVSDIYSGKIDNWKALGGDDRPIVRLSRETNSGTHIYFLETVLRLGEKENKTLFSTDTLLLPSSEIIISEVRQNPNAIGYDGLGYVTDEVKVIALSEESGGNYILPSAETVSAGEYPVARDLYMYTNGEPTGEIKQYLEWIWTPEAQAIIKELGFIPASAGANAPTN